MRILCPYCEQPIKDYSRDHIFPEFLGGSWKIPACKQCNERFGSTIEGRAAAMLFGLQVSMATWGLSFSQAVPAWRRALEHMGLEFDISIEDGEPKLQLSRPIKEMGKEGKLTSISFGNKKEAERAVKQARKKGYDKAVVQKISMEMPTPHIPFVFDLGPSVQRTALKLCYALSTSLPGFTLDEVAHARAILKSDPDRLPPGVIPSFEIYESLDAMRAPLSHVIYVERDETVIYGVVQFFGVIQLFCGLGKPNGSAPRAARIGILDPITGVETFPDVAPLDLPLPTSVGYEELPQVADTWLKRFQEGAVMRGATKPIKLEGELSYKANP
jgi:HNH endonuclease